MYIRGHLFNFPFSPSGGWAAAGTERGYLSHLSYWNLLHKMLDVCFFWFFRVFNVFSPKTSGPPWNPPAPPRNPLHPPRHAWTPFYPVFSPMPPEPLDFPRPPKPLPLKSCICCCVHEHPSPKSPELVPLFMPDPRLMSPLMLWTSFNTLRKGHVDSRKVFS